MPSRPGTAGYFASTSGSWLWPPAPPQHSKHTTGLCESSMKTSVSGAFIPPMLCGHDEIELVGLSGGNRSTKRKRYKRGRHCISELSTCRNALKFLDTNKVAYERASRFPSNCDPIRLS
jgi:hypothetical protein